MLKAGTSSSVDPSTICDPITNIDNFVFIDMQGFKVPINQFMVKEFCLINGTDNNEFHVIVKPNYNYRVLPSFYQRQADWLTNCFHGLKYECGKITINEVGQIVYPKIKNKTVVVKGQEKVEWLTHIFKKYGEVNCTNIEDCGFDMSNIESYVQCGYHQNINYRKCHCARSNAMLLRDIVHNNLKFNSFEDTFMQ